MTAGQFITLEILASNFGQVRVRETAIVLRNNGLFEKGWTSIDPLVAAHFIFALCASSRPAYALQAIRAAYSLASPQHPVLNAIARLLTDADYRSSVKEIHVSKKNGATKFFYVGGSVEYFYPSQSVDYEQFDFDGEEVDSFTKVGGRFFSKLANILKYEEVKTV